MLPGNDGDAPVLEARSRRVLVVEDDPGLCEAVARVARGRSAEVWEARTLLDGLRLLEQGPDLVIADLRLGDASAFPLFEAAARRAPAPALVAMSGQASAEESFLLGRLGVRAYLAKPFGSGALLAALERAERGPGTAAPGVPREPETTPGRGPVAAEAQPGAPTTLAEEGPGGPLARLARWASRALGGGRRGARRAPPRRER